MTHMADIVDEIEMGLTPIIKQVLTSPAYQLQRPFVCKREGGIYVTCSLSSEFVGIRRVSGFLCGFNLGEESAFQSDRIHGVQFFQETPGPLLGNKPSRMIRVDLSSNRRYRHRCTETAADEGGKNI